MHYGVVYEPSRPRSAVGVALRGIFCLVPKSGRKGRVCVWLSVTAPLGGRKKRTLER